jgi:two-component system sensor histidine kinase RstB
MNSAEAEEFIRGRAEALGVDSRLAELSDPVMAPELRDEMNAGRVALRRYRSGLNYGVRLYIPVTVENHRSVLVVGPVSRPYSPDFKAYMYMGALVLVILMATTMAVSLPMFRRMRILEKTARAVSEGHLDARIPIPADDGMVGTLASQFNTMVERIEKLLASQKMILQAVAHELRTPSARIRFGLEMLDTATDQQERERRLNAIDEDLADLDDMVEELLVYNKTEALGSDIDTAAVEVLPSLERMLEKRSFIRPGVEVRFDCPDKSISARVDPRAFARAIGNLVSNALRFSKSRVNIVIRGDGGEVMVAVCDDGPGVPEADRETVLEPFKRLDTSRNRESGGAGLGLAIVSSIIKSHGGRIEVGDADIGGARFATWWPAA